MTITVAFKHRLNILCPNYMVISLKINIVTCSNNNNDNDDDNDDNDDDNHINNNNNNSYLYTHQHIILTALLASNSCPSISLTRSI